MADIGTTATAVAYAVAQAIYPNGISASSASGRRTIIRRGWLLQSDLTGACALRNGIDYITVMPLAGKVSLHDRPLSCPWRDVSVQSSNIITSVSGTTITLTAADNNALTGVVGLRYLPDFDSLEPSATIATTQAVAGDTLATIATRLAAQIPQVTAQANVINCVGARDVEAKSSGFVTQARITRRQTSEFCISVWSGSWQGRDATGQTLDTALSDQRFIPNMDGTVSQMEFANVREIDAQQADGIFRRDYMFSVTYDTIQTQVSPTVMWVVGNGVTKSDSGDALFIIGNSRPNVGVLSSDGQTYYIDAAGNLVLQAAPPYGSLVLDAVGNVVENRNV